MATDSGLSRRDLMKKGAVAGAIVWSAPLLTSTPAFAATAQCAGSRPCTDYYYFKWDNNGCAFDAAGSDAPSCPTALPLDDIKCSEDDEDIVLQNPCGLLTPLQNQPGGVLFEEGRVRVKLPTGSVPLILRIKPGNACAVYLIPEDIATCDTTKTPPETCPPATKTTLTYDSGATGVTLEAYLEIVSDGIILDVTQTSQPQGTGQISHFSLVFCL